MLYTVVCGQPNRVYLLLLTKKYEKVGAGKRRDIMYAVFCCNSVNNVFQNVRGSSVRVQLVFTPSRHFCSAHSLAGKKFLLSPRPSSSLHSSLHPLIILPLRGRKRERLRPRLVVHADMLMSREERFSPSTRML